MQGAKDSEVMTRSNLRRTLGEFVLIVLGVLAALSAESWMSRSAERSLAEAYQSDLLNDLRADSIQIAHWMALTENRRVHLQLMIDDLNGRARLEPGSALATLFQASIVPAPSFPQTTLEDLTSTGNLRLLDRELRRAIFQYRESHVQLEADRAVWGLAKPTFARLLPGGFQAAVLPECFREDPNGPCRTALAEQHYAEMSRNEIVALDSWRDLPEVRGELQMAIASSGTYTFFLDLVEARRAAVAELLR